MGAAHAIPAAEPGLDERRLRDAFGRFATGVTFVTTQVEGTPLGLIVSSFTAVSLRPPLVSFCPARDSLTWRRMRLAGDFAVTVLGGEHAGFAQRAAEPGADRFAEPVHDALAVIECSLEAEHATGDHWIVVGRVRRLRLSSGANPLVYFAGGFGAFHPQRPGDPVSTDLEPIVDTLVLRDHVRDMYRDVAQQPDGDFHFETGRALAERLGYPAAWLDTVPLEALDSFAGVGHMLDLAAIAPGETVLDLGSGSGTDSFIAGELTGPEGRVIGVDMTDAQLSKACRLRDGIGLQHITFVEGFIEEPPAEPESVDVVISNGVINLAPDKGTVFRAVARALRPGGRLAIADIVSERELIERTRRNVALWAACIAGAVPQGDYLGAIEAAGLRVELVRENPAYRFLTPRAREAADKYGVASVTVLATKP